MKSIWKWLTLLLALSGALAACGGAETAVTPAATLVPVSSTAPPVTPTSPPADTTEAYHPENLALIGATGRPQLINIYASWWSTWRANAPIVNGVRQTFADEIDYFIVDIDKPESRDVMANLGVRNRSTYLLLDAAGNELLRLVGPLYSQEDVAASINAALAAAGR